MIEFKVEKNDGSARRGVLKTPHGELLTPAFVPVATRGALKGVSFERAASLGSSIFMVNTFHFYCREEYETVARAGGLHAFSGSFFPLMTDSGGFQVFSLGAGWERGVGKMYKEGSADSRKGMVKITEEGAVFRSPLDGKRVVMTPESSIDAQEKLGADIIFAFDECTSPLASREYQEKSLQRTNRWAKRCLDSLSTEQALFGIVQGGRFEDLRKESARFMSSLEFPGFGIGGSFGESFGDSKKNMHRMLEVINKELPEEKPRHLLGIGEVDDILESVERGVDLFDCVIPTRFARHATAITSQGRVNLRSPSFKESTEPIDKECSCNSCLTYERRYIHHLCRKGEMYGIIILLEHNLYFMMKLMERIREAINEGSFSQLKKSLLRK